MDDKKPSGDTSSEAKGNLNAKRDSVSDALIRTVSATEVLSSDSESSDFTREYTCDICDKWFSGLKSLEQHEKGGRHLKALRKQKLKKELEDRETEESSDEDFSSHREQIYKECEACGKEFNGPESFSLHIRSKRHKKKVANSKILEQSKEDGKVNVDKLKQIMKMHSSAPAASGETDSSSEADEDTSSRVLECEDCDKVFSGLEPFRDHMTSKTHHKTLKQKKMMQKLASFDPENTIEIVDGDITCRLCRIVFSGPESTLAHLKGKGHMEWLEFKKWKKERKNSGRQESELFSEASSSAEPTENSSLRSNREHLGTADDSESAKTENKESKSESVEARILYKNYKETINKSEPIE